MKTCPECNLSLPLSAYNRDPQKKDGHRNVCKVCRNARERMIKRARLMGKEVRLRRILDGKEVIVKLKKK